MERNRTAEIIFLVALVAIFFVGLVVTGCASVPKPKETKACTVPADADQFTAYATVLLCCEDVCKDAGLRYATITQSKTDPTPKCVCVQK